MHDVIRQGIVLRVRTPYHKKIVVFDALYGKISVLPQAAVPLVHGHLLSYRLEPWKHLYLLCDLQVLKLPGSWVYNDILFLHHLLEMALFFLPEQSCAASVFQLCMLLYEAEQTHIEHGLLKKLFLGKFFALLGVYPEQALRYDEQLFHLFAGGSQALSRQALPRQVLPQQILPRELEDIDELHEKLERWLLGCIQTHPHAKTFTTIHFLYAQGE